MRKKIILIYLLIAVFVLLLGGYFFLYNIYGSEVKRSAQNMYADTFSEITIEVIPVNALGKKAWFRKSSATFEIVEGLELIEIIEHNKESGFIKIRSKGEAGLVEVKIKSEHSLLAEYIEIEILALNV
jgi:hypothetical protein